MACIPDIKLIRTDTTLDLSQKAEKNTAERSAATRVVARIYKCVRLWRHGPRRPRFQRPLAVPRGPLLKPPLPCSPHCMPPRLRRRLCSRKSMRCEDRQQSANCYVSVSFLSGHASPGRDAVEHGAVPQPFPPAQGPRDSRRQAATRGRPRYTS